LEDEKIIFEKVRQIFVNSKIIKETKNPDSCNVYNILKLFLNENDNYIIRKKYRE
jgi:tryptophanyl-tRNA synthetase